MKAKLIIANWCLSFCGLCIDTERSPMWAVLVVVAWFVIASLLLQHAYKKGWLNKVVKRI